MKCGFLSKSEYNIYLISNDIYYVQQHFGRVTKLYIFDNIIQTSNLFVRMKNKLKICTPKCSLHWRYLLENNVGFYNTYLIIRNNGGHGRGDDLEVWNLPLLYCFNYCNWTTQVIAYSYRLRVLIIICSFKKIDLVICIRIINYLN